jgi:cystathionine beta-lyase
MNKRVDSQIFGYSMADEGYYDSVAKWFADNFNWQVRQKDIFITSGVIPALETIISIYSNIEDGVIIQPPVYHMFAKVIERADRKIVNNPLVETEGQYRIDFSDLENKAKDPNNKILLFCSPHNPTGNVWSRDDLLRVAEICRLNDVLLVSDEIHFDLVRRGIKHVPMSRLLPKDAKLITCTAPSKTFNLAGLHMSNIVIENKELQEAWNAKVGFSLPSPIGVEAVKAAYGSCGPWLKELNDYLDANFAFAAHYLEKHLPRARFIVPDGTYFIWLDLRAYGYSSVQLDEIMIKRANVLLEGGTMFGKEGEGYQRINIACTRKTLEEALCRICSAMS